MLGAGGRVQGRGAVPGREAVLVTKPVDVPDVGQQPRFPHACSMATWTWSDAWVFSSIAITGRDDGSRVSEIIMTADGINHAILTEAEFIHAVPRLVAAGLIRADADADRYWLTDSGRALYRQRMKRRGLFGWMDAMPPALDRLGEPEANAWSLPAGAFDQAARDHLKLAEQILKPPDRTALQDPRES